MPKEFRNVKMSAKVSANTAKLDITVDVSEYMQGAELPISSTGVTYNVASTFGGHRLDAELDGLIIDLKVYTKKEFYEKRQAYAKQVRQAQEALQELQQNEGALALFTKMGFTKEQAAAMLAAGMASQAQA